MEFKRGLFNKINGFLRKFGFQISPVTERDDIKRFFNNLHPVTTNHELIRIGNEDGGYLVPDDLNGIAACFSPGVSSLADFEDNLTKRDIKCFLADYSVGGPPIQNELFSFSKKYLGNRNDEIFTTLEKWVNDNVPNDESDLILQMDIESAEYDVFLETPDHILNRFRIMVLEFHNLDNLLLDRYAFKTLDNTFKRLSKNFSIVHIHPNNYYMPVKYQEFEIPTFVEFTFLRKDRIERSEPTLSFPHKLDKKNSDRNIDYPLPECWYLST